MANFLKRIATVVSLIVFLVACSQGVLAQKLVEPGEVTITMVVPYPDERFSPKSPGIPGVVVTCTVGCEGLQTEVTDDQGEVTLTGNAPLTIRAEKSGYVPVEQRVSADSWIAMGNEWPPEAEVAVHQLGLASAIASGEILLIWDDGAYLPALSKEFGDDDGLGGFGYCPEAFNGSNERQVMLLIVRETKWRDIDFAIFVLVHEALHAWQGLMSTDPPCGVSEWPQSESGIAWVAATKSDLEGVGPIPGFDDREYGTSGRVLSEIPFENQAMVYSGWYSGTLWWREGIADRSKICQLAPNRCRYLEGRFGPPPPR